jgi:hypothetical protein
MESCRPIRSLIFEFRKCILIFWSDILQRVRAPSDVYSFILPPDEFNFLVDKSEAVELAEEMRLITEKYTAMPAVRAMGV